MRAIHLLPSAAVVLSLLTGCSSAATPQPAFPTPPGPVAVDDDRAFAPVADERKAEATPRSVHRLVAEERAEVDALFTLASELPDPRGRARAMSEAEAVSRELREVEALLDAAGADTDALDDVMRRLDRVSTRVDLLHEALRNAAFPL